MTLNIDEEQDVSVTKGMIRAEFNFWVGIVMDKFYDGLQEKKFIGTKCSKCGKVFLPPRNRCGDCFAKAEDFIDLPETGILKNFTVTTYKISERKTRNVKKDQIVGLVQIDGADSAMVVPVININPEDLKIGMKLKVVWAKNIKGDPNDIAGFEPIGGV
ncbi:MAG: Zn-ribbon domain-containing OB-fold protein [Promethearchaeota archaeon]|nr:MAG: Zn-ribbon domain-containing OB-fold protein [Candidatus Lokiarchaeota archaeon]TFG22564.1 MAG: Zn-ribbon domain-containing OB-fold protein [Candidatus Lokiarchaeota archaeon]